MELVNLLQKWWAADGGTAIYFVDYLDYSVALPWVIIFMAHVYYGESYL